MRCQGQWEAAAATILAACPFVVSIEEQPLAIWYAWRETAGRLQIQLLSERPSRRRGRRGLRFSHIVPDFLVGMRDGRKRLIEVKPSDRLRQPSIQRKLAVGRLYAARHGGTFHVLTERELFHGPLLTNLRLLGRYRHLAADASLLDLLEAAVTGEPRMLADLLRMDGQGTPSVRRAAVLHLLAVGRLAWDPRVSVLNDRTLISPGGSLTWDPFDSVWAPSGCATDGPSASSGS
ncbi:MAG: TnsA endonuclease N-terminal domain-containing protein [Planctomycetaceae bacterium]|nr:TnsA endonuclease N-terminal domain-containing protein [Planctomycetaceae bacterium]